MVGAEKRRPAWKGVSELFHAAGCWTGNVGNKGDAVFQGRPLGEEEINEIRGKKLEALGEVLTPDVFEDLAATPASGTVLVPQVVFWLMACVALGDGTFAGAMTTFWTVLPPQCAAQVPLRPMTPAAFCTARHKLPLSFFIGLFQAFISRFQQQFGERYRWRGFSLCAIDGSVVDLPPGAKELKEKFCPGSNELGPGKRPQALLVGLIDVWSGLCLGFNFVSTKMGEIAAAASVVSCLGPEHLLLADRNFACFEMMARVLKQQAELLFRLQEGRFTGAKHHRQRIGPNEWLLTISPTEESRKHCPEFDQPIVLRLIQYQVRGFRPSYLITSLLDPYLYHWQDLVILYHERWREEVAFRDWKHTLTLSNLRSQSEVQLLKETYVQITLNNAVRWVMAEAGGVSTAPVCLQFLESKRLILAASGRMAVARPSDIPRIYAQLLREVAACRILVRPHRSYPRNKRDGKAKDKGKGTVTKPNRVPIQPGIEMALDYIDFTEHAFARPDAHTMTI